MVELFHIYVLFPVVYICLYNLIKLGHIVDTTVSHVMVNVCLQKSILFFYDYKIWVINIHGVLGRIDVLRHGGISSLHSEFNLYRGQQKINQEKDNKLLWDWTQGE